MPEVSMSRSAWFALLLAMAPLCAAPCAAQPQPEIVAMVGRLVSIKELPNPCESRKAPADPSSTCIFLDALYEAKYEVTEVLSGHAGGPEITFRIADHYGFPRFAHYRNALLFISLGSEGNYLEKYQGYPVHRTTGGTWASCGDPYNEFADKPARGLQTIDFADDLGIVGDFSEEGMRERFPDVKYLDVSGGRIRCRRGIPLTELYERVRTGVLAARGFSLPALDR
jgi:hypothetical protein